MLVSQEMNEGRLFCAALRMTIVYDKCNCGNWVPSSLWQLVPHFLCEEMFVYRWIFCMINLYLKALSCFMILFVSIWLMLARTSYYIGHLFSFLFTAIIQILMSEKVFTFFP